MRFRSGLRLAVVGSGLPYGYTLTTFASGQSVIHVHGSPAVGLLLLFAAGAGAAFGALRATTRGLVVPVVHLGESPALMRALVVQTVAVGGAVLAAAAAATCRSSRPGRSPGSPRPRSTSPSSRWSSHGSRGRARGSARKA